MFPLKTTGVESPPAALSPAAPAFKLWLLRLPTDNVPMYAVNVRTRLRAGASVSTDPGYPTVDRVAPVTAAGPPGGYNVMTL